MPLNSYDLTPLETTDILEAGRVKVNNNFEAVRQFVNSLESTSGSSGGGGATQTINQAGHGFSVGSLVRVSSSGSYLAANAQTEASARVVGIVTNVMSSDQFEVTFSGIVGGLSGLVTGSLHYLQNNGTLGITPGTVARGVLVATSPTSGVFINESSAQLLGSLGDVSTNGVQLGDVLTYTTANGGSWTPSEPTLSALKDVGGGAPTVGQILMYNGSVWAPQAPSGGGDMYMSVYDSVGNGVVNAARAVAWSGVSGAPAFSLPGHTHSTSEVINLDTLLSGKASTAHTHADATTGAAGFMSVADKQLLAGATASGGGDTLMRRTGGRAKLTFLAIENDDIANKLYVDTAISNSGGTGGSGMPPAVSLGDLASTTTLAVSNNEVLYFHGRLVRNVTLSTSGVPSNTLVVLTIALAQDATGGYTVTYPSNTTFLNGADGSISSAPNSVSVITLVTRNGGSSWVAAIADTRATKLDPLYVNPQGDGSYYVVVDSPVTMDFANVMRFGTGTVTYHRSTNNGSSWGSSLTAAQAFSSGNILRITVSGFSSSLALTIPRTASS